MKTSKAGLHLPKAIHAQGQNWVNVWQKLPLFELSNEQEIALLKDAAKVLWQGRTSFLCMALAIALDKPSLHNFELTRKINCALDNKPSLVGYTVLKLGVHPYVQGTTIPFEHFRILWISKLLLACPLTSFNDRQWARFQINKVIKQHKLNLQQPKE